VAIWRRRRRADPDVEQARRRLDEARRDLEAAKEDDGRVDEVARRIYEIRKANRFAAMMKAALRGSP
jgi:hypothetical protein